MPARLSRWHHWWLCLVLNLRWNHTMATNAVTDLTIPSSLATQIQAAADRQNRPVADIVRDALEHYLAGFPDVTGSIGMRAALPGRTPAEAAARLLQNREGNVLPRGLTIRGMQTHGRA
jgi:hypothetical protein